VTYNNGELDHEFVLASTEENSKHAEAINLEMEHDDPNATCVAPKQRSEPDGMPNDVRRKSMASIGNGLDGPNYHMRRPVAG
jgi:hypothetical protein